MIKRNFLVWTVSLLLMLFVGVGPGQPIQAQDDDLTLPAEYYLNYPFLDEAGTASNTAAPQELDLYFTVINRAGQAVPAPDINEAKVRLGDAEFPAIIEIPDDIPLYVTVVLDLSGSMRPAAALMREAAVALVDSVPPGTWVSVVTFNERNNISPPEPHSADLQIARDRIRGIADRDFTGGTCLYDATQQAVMQLQAIPLVRRAVVTFTDGEDVLRPNDPNSAVCSATPLAELLRTAGLSGQIVPIYPIGLVGGSGADPNVLREMAGQTGGIAALLESSAEQVNTAQLNGLFQEIVAALNGQRRANASICVPAGRYTLTLLGTVNGEDVQTAFGNIDISTTCLPPTQLPPTRQPGIRIDGFRRSGDQLVFDIRPEGSIPFAAYRLLVVDQNGEAVGETPRALSATETTVSIPLSLLGANRLRFTIEALTADGTVLAMSENEFTLQATATPTLPPTLTLTPTPTAPPPINLVIDPVPMDGGSFAFDVVLTSGQGVREFRVRLFRESGEPVVGALREQFVPIADASGAVPNTTRIELPISQLPCGPLVVRVRPLGDSRIFLTNEEYVSDAMVVVCTQTPTSTATATYSPTFTPTFTATATASPEPLVLTVGEFRPERELLSFEVRRIGVGEVLQYRVSALNQDTNGQIFTPIPWDVERNIDLPTVIQIPISSLPQTDMEFCVEAIGANGRAITRACNTYNLTFTQTPTFTASPTPTATDTPLPLPTPTQPLRFTVDSLLRRDDSTYALEIATSGDDPVVNYQVKFVTEGGETLYETTVRVTGNRTLVLFPTENFTESFTIVLSALDANNNPLPRVATVTRESRLSITPTVTPTFTPTPVPERINLGGTIAYDAATRQFAIPASPEGDDPITGYTVIFAVNGAVRSQIEKLEPPTTPILFSEDELSAFLLPGDYDVFVRLTYASGQEITEQIPYEHTSSPPAPPQPSWAERLLDLLPIIVLVALILLIIVAIIWWRSREKPEPSIGPMDMPNPSMPEDDDNTVVRSTGFKKGQTTRLAQVKIVRPARAQGGSESFTLYESEGEVVLGRYNRNGAIGTKIDLPNPDSEAPLSRTQATLRFENGMYHIKSNHDDNPVFLNGAQLNTGQFYPLGGEQLDHTIEFGLNRQVEVAFTYFKETRPTSASPVQLFVEVTEPDTLRTPKIEITRTTTTLGYGDQADIILKDANQEISRRHLTLRRGQDACYITDLGSGNGTFLDGRQLTANQEEPLPYASIVTLGTTPPTALRITWTDGREEDDRTNIKNSRKSGQPASKSPDDGDKTNVKPKAQRAEQPPQPAQEDTASPPPAGVPSEDKLEDEEENTKVPGRQKEQAAVFGQTEGEEGADDTPVPDSLNQRARSAAPPPVQSKQVNISAPQASPRDEAATGTRRDRSRMVNSNLPDYVKASLYVSEGPENRIGLPITVIHDHTIGRVGGNNITDIEDSNDPAVVSRQHARLYWDEQEMRFFLTDRGSKYGTEVIWKELGVPARRIAVEKGRTQPDPHRPEHKEFVLMLQPDVEYTIELGGKAQSDPTMRYLKPVRLEFTYRLEASDEARA